MALHFIEQLCKFTFYNHITFVYALSNQHYQQMVHRLFKIEMQPIIMIIVE